MYKVLKKWKTKELSLKAECEFGMKHLKPQKRFNLLFSQKSSTEIEMAGVPENRFFPKNMIATVSDER